MPQGFASTRRVACRRGAPIVMALAGLGVLLVMLVPAAAQSPPAPPPAQSAPPAPNYDANLFGSMLGLRPALAANGLTFTLTDTTDMLGNPTGGLRQEAVLDGFGFASLALDGGKAGLLDGLTAQVSAWGIYGRGLTANALGNLHTVTNAEADRALLLFELWADQAMFDGKVSLRIGQQAADQEFMVDPYSSVFINAHYGFPNLPSIDLPGGGPDYPLATPAVRLKLQPGESVTLLAALFNGDPVAKGAPLNDPQAGANGGVNFRTDAGALWIGEAQWARNQGDDAKGLPATYKIGFWYHNGPFSDQRLDSDYVSLASPASNGRPLIRRGDYSVYIVLDQMLWRPPGAKDGGIAGFFRAMGAPADRNLVELSLDTGLTWQGIMPARANDTAGIGLEWARVGDQSSKLDSDIARYEGIPYPVRRWEAVLELTYQAQLRPWWNLQPDMQYVVRPGGGIPALDDPGRRAADALVLGLRSAVTF